jgi:hypothetical protein
LKGIEVYNWPFLNLRSRAIDREAAKAELRAIYAEMGESYPSLLDWCCGAYPEGRVEAMLRRRRDMLARHRESEACRRANLASEPTEFCPATQPASAFCFTTGGGRRVIRSAATFS